MGAAPSRETLRRGLYNVPTQMKNNVDSSRSQSKPDIVLIPLIKEYFPSADCPLFVQFHKMRCDPGVNYYFRHPLYPGDLSRIPNVHSNDARSSNRSRDALYSEFVEQTEERLFDTDKEMRQAHELSMSDRSAGGSPSFHMEGAKTANVGKKVLPIICAVAFLHDREKFEQLQQTQGTPGGSRVPHVLMGRENSDILEGKVVNIIGFFGMLPREIERKPLTSPVIFSPVSPGLSATGKGIAAPSMLKNSLSLPCTARGPSHGSSQDLQQLIAPLSSQASVASGSELRNRPSFVPTQHVPPERCPLTASAGAFSLVSSLGGTPAREPSARQRPFLQSEGLLREMDQASSYRCTALEERLSRFGLPAPAAAEPLTAVVFMTKSAGEQNLCRVTFVAAKTYHGQLVEAGVLKQRGNGPSPPLESERRYLPPLETFSFSSLMTNVPFISFVYEMRCRWGRFGFFSRRVDSPSLRMGSLNVSSSFTYGFTGGAHSEAPNLEETHRGFAMWLTKNGVFHGRIERELAEHLCFCMAGQPDFMSVPAATLPIGGGYWRFRGLVDRNNPRPIQLCGDGAEAADPLDVYVMGSPAVGGFDEGDVLKYDQTSRSWVANRDIPLDAVVLAAMRPFCKAARTAPPDDIGWVTVEVEEQDEMGVEDQDHLETAGKRDMDTGAVVRQEDRDGTVVRKRVHVREGNFYIYRFELNGEVHYHGTVPDFANPNKKRASHSSSVGARSVAPMGPAAVARRFDNTNERGRQHSVGSTADRSTNEHSLSVTSTFSPPFVESFMGSERTSATFLASPLQPVREAISRSLGTVSYSNRGYESTGSQSSFPVVPVTPDTMFPPSRGLTTPVARRRPTFVPVGSEVEVDESQRDNESDGGATAFVRRFIDSTVYIWDWRYCADR